MCACQVHASHCTASRGVRAGQQPPRSEKSRGVCVHSASRQTALAATLLSTLLALNPAARAATLGSSDYISVQERTRQRAPLQQPLLDRDANREGPSNSSPRTSLSIPQQVAEVRRLSAEAQEAADTQNYEQALQTYTIITRNYPDLAVVQYARIKRALMLYQLGKTVDAVLEMEGESSDLLGNAEVHAALAAMLYSESPKQIRRAETQWEIAREFDQRYSDLTFVKLQKRWPPAMQLALENFLSLS